MCVFHYIDRGMEEYLVGTLVSVLVNNGVFFKKKKVFPKMLKVDN